jgi:hypothetical protein
MASIGLNSEECIKYLQEYSDKIDEITSLICNGRVIPGQKEKAQSLLKAFKESLQEDYHSRSILTGEKKMTRVEKSFFYPAIHEAFAIITIRYNSIPSGKWHSELYDAQYSIKYYLNDLKRME